MRRYGFLLFLWVLFVPAAIAQDLGIGPEDVRIEQSLDGGYYLYVRDTADIGSVLLTESTEDPLHRASTFALRNPNAHPENSQEQRLLDGEFLPEGHNSLIDSTPIDDEAFGAAFRVFIPYIVEYGYDWTRSGEIQVFDGTYLSIRAFELPYADYRGEYRDNPFVIRVTQRPMAGPPEGNYMPDTVREFEEIAKTSEGTTRYSASPEQLVAEIEAIVEESAGPDIDLVLCLDTTQSMDDDMPELQERLVPMLREQASQFERFRIGLVPYRDYLEEYLNYVVPFTDNLDDVERSIRRVRVAGGRDIPEAVYEALYAALIRFHWSAADRRIVLIGDAPPHPRPRGAVTEEMVFSRAEADGVVIDVIILPQ